jgi:hypothetical protein
MSRAVAVMTPGGKNEGDPAPGVRAARKVTIALQSDFARTLSI